MPSQGLPLRFTQAQTGLLPRLGAVEAHRGPRLPACMSCPALGASALTQGCAKAPPLPRGSCLCRAVCVRVPGLRLRWKCEPGSVPLRTAGSPCPSPDHRHQAHRPLTAFLVLLLFSYFPPSSLLHVICIISTRIFWRALKITNIHKLQRKAVVTCCVGPQPLGHLQAPWLGPRGHVPADCSGSFQNPRCHRRRREAGEPGHRSPRNDASQNAEEGRVVLI